MVEGWGLRVGGGRWRVEGWGEGVCWEARRDRWRLGGEKRLMVSGR